MAGIGKPPKRYTKMGTIISRSWTPEWVERVNAQEEALGHQICGAKSAKVGDGSGRPCRHRPGFGTEHEGEGRCKYHGGNAPVGSGRWSVLRHYDLRNRIQEFFLEPELMDIRSAVGTAWAALDALLEEDAVITPERAQEIVSHVARISTMIKQHHDITEGQKIRIEVPQFMEWAESFYELAIKYIQQAGGDVRGFLAEAQQYYSGTVSSITGDRPPAFGDGRTVETEVVLRP
jgi:hypothetical protein